jgi:Zn-dependent protease
LFGGGSSLPLVRLFGIRIGVNPTWFVVLFLWIYVLQGSFHNAIADANTGFVAAVVSAFLFFGSIVLHELGHALAARREGIGVVGIDLFFFGGFMRADRDSETPGEEFRVAAAGPAVTLLLAVVFGALGYATIGDFDQLLHAAFLDFGSGNFLQVVLAFAAASNAALLLFNLVPAFPLDGGRLARAVAWRISGDRHRATRFAAYLGQGFAGLLIVYGIYLGLSKNDVFSGLWYVVLGWMLGGGARAAVAQSGFSQRLEGVTAGDIMDSEPVTIPADMPVMQAYEDFFLRYDGWPWFAVVEEDGRLVGIAYRAAVEHVAREEGGTLLVRQVVADGDSVSTDTPLETLIGSEPLRRVGALMAVDADGHLRGVVTVEQVSRALQARLA